MRVARRYGERPEISGNVGWRVLKELSSTMTSDEERQKFEARILDGKRVDGAEIIRARDSATAPRQKLARAATKGRAAIERGNKSAARA